MKFPRLLILFIFIIFGMSCFSSSTAENKFPPQSIEELQIQLEDILKDAHVPGMSIAIVQRDGPEWIAGLGNADLDSNRSANAATLFRIGSVSKGFVSLAVLKLVSESKLSLEDPLRTLAPEVWFDNQWETNEPIRIVHLLENTTGWDDMHLREFAKNRSKLSSLDALDYDHSSRICRWRPGTRMSYCNSGSAVAAYIVEKITGKNFDEYIAENFFKPIGMETTTYSQPNLEQTTTLYHSNGQTPHIYWDLLYPSIGSINASAKDMANYLLFYLNRGKVHERQVVPSQLFSRLENSTSTWAAKEGFHVGYGLGNYWSIHDGFVYHGHDGNVPGGLSMMAYMPKEGIGYFYSLNSENREALKNVGTVIRAYITRHLQKPSIPPTVLLSDNVNTYSGWYEPNSPRMKLFYFFERLAGMAYIQVQDNKLFINSLSEKNATFLPVSDTEFFYVPAYESPDSVPTLKLLTPNAEGQFIQLSLGDRNAASLHVTLKRIPTWLAIFEITITGFVILMILSTLIYAPFWLLTYRSKKQPRSVEHSLLWRPLIAVLSLLCIVIICMFSRNVFIAHFGNLTISSFSLFLATLLFAVASVASIVAVWRTSKAEVRSIVYIYSAMVSLALVISTIYLTYWGIIGLRTWA